MPFIVSANFTMTAAIAVDRGRVHPRRPPPVEPHQQIQRHEREPPRPRRAPGPARAASPRCRRTDRTTPISSCRPSLEQLPQRLDVRGGAGDQPARGVALVEVHAQRLGVPEDPAAQVQQHVLVDPGGGPDERVLEPAGSRARTADSRRADRDQRPVVVVPERRDAAVDGVRHQQRARLHRRLLEQQQHARPPTTRPRMRREQGAQQGDGSRPGVRAGRPGRRGRRRRLGAGRRVRSPAGRLPSGRASLVCRGRRLGRPCAMPAASAGSLPGAVGPRAPSSPVRPVPTSARRTPRSSRSSSWWVPTAVIRPPDSSATRSASITVDGRCATTSAVVSASTRRSAASTSGLRVHVERGQRVVQHQEARPARPPPGPARGAGAGRRRGSGPARRPGCPVPWGSACTKSAWATARARPQLGPRPRPSAPIRTFSPTVAENSVGSSKATATSSRSRCARHRRRCPRRPA